jgi:hypothetical protein
MRQGHIGGMGPGLKESGSVPVFDYDENDVETLEKEIEQVIRCGTAKTFGGVGNLSNPNLMNL